jgi:2-pyrone-4,6-dicarboxylate lactonase
MRHITPTILPFHPAPRKPRLLLPQGAVDSHCHIFGPDHLYPYVENRPYTPHDAPYAKLVALHDHLGISKAVIVNATCHGRDNSVVTDAISKGEGRFKGVGNVDINTPRAEIKRLNDLGITGCRFTFLPRLGTLPDMTDLTKIAHIIAEFNWHIDLYLPATLLPDFAPRLRELPVNYVLDHLGVVKPGESKAFDDLQKLYESDEKCWIKISCPERLTALGVPYNDISPFAKRLIKADNTRLLWGTDWPHPNVPAMPDDGDLVDWLSDITTPAETTQLTVTNPTRFFGF